MSIVDEVRRLAAESPEAVYQESPCHYGIGKCGNGEGCIIGQAIVAWCPDMEVYLDFEDQKAINHKHNLNVYQIVNDHGLNHLLTKKEIDFCREVQAEQDRRKPWAEAVASADRMMEAFV